MLGISYTFQFDSVILSSNKTKIMKINEMKLTEQSVISQVRKIIDFIWQSAVNSNYRKIIFPIYDLVDVNSNQKVVWEYLLFRIRKVKGAFCVFGLPTTMTN